MMEVAVTFNKEKGRDELLFSEELPKGTATFLKEKIGLRQHFKSPRKWLSINHPAYQNYLQALAEALAKGASIESVPLLPSFESSLANINQNRFSYVTISFGTEDHIKQEEYVVFDPFKKVSTFVAESFGRQKFGSAFKEVRVFPRTQKVKARALFKEGMILAPKADDFNEGSGLRNDEVPTPKQLSIAERKQLVKQFIAFAAKREEDLPEVQIEGHEFPILLSGWLRHNYPEYHHLKEEIWPVVENAREKTQHEDETPLAEHSTVVLADYKSFRNAKDFGIEILKESESYADEEGVETLRAEKAENWKLVELSLKDVQLKDVKASLGLGFVQESFDYWKEKIASGERPPILLFRSLKGGAPFYDLLDGHHRLLAYQALKIEKVKAIVQSADATKDIVFRHFCDLYAFDIKADAKLCQPSWELTLSAFVERAAKRKARSSSNRDSDSQEPIGQEHKEVVKAALSQGLDLRKEVLKDYPELTKEHHSDYLDRVIAHMHDAYAANKRVTKGQVEKLAKALKVLNMGIMWESVELSWMLWYRALYREPIPFEHRLAKMIHFWHHVQPTYAYSDSSKEIYKQYSTPCPIGAIVAEYTGMKNARRIFEPSAGNGLLLVGADPAKTHANEIDKTRIKSLEFVQFSTITSFNAAEPFPKTLDRSFDVVITNPPFSRWEEEKYDKAYIIQTYFHNHIGLAQNIRLEHVMSGLALHTMKDNGRAAIIIMGHIYFGEDGLIAKYRPFFNWLFRHYKVDDVINLNSFKLYNKQGAIEKTMLILISGRKPKPAGVAPQSWQRPEFNEMVNSFEALWQRVKQHLINQSQANAQSKGDIDQVIEQLKNELEP
ncbi:MAG: N-6 DNA methylase [Cytophagales bacterium]|nr:N-6 DNA methylase [Cytophagales bacterium]